MVTINTNLQMKNWRLRAVKSLSLGHTVKEAALLGFKPRFIWFQRLGPLIQIVLVYQAPT